MKNNPILGFAIGTGVAAGTAAAIRAWTTWGYADAIGAAAGAALGGLAYMVKPLKSNAINIAAGAVISQAPKIVEQLIAGTASAQGLVSVQRLQGHLGEVRADPVRGLLGEVVNINGSSANVGTHFGSVPLAGAH